MTLTKDSRILIVGLGLMGGSYARALTISVVVNAAPCSRHMPRKAKSVTPAMGASVSRPSIGTLPIFTIACPALRGSDPSR